MRNLLSCRRGSVAFATVVALVPLIGVVALGAEAGSWYVTRQHAQNAADAAAISAGIRVACTISGSGSTVCDQSQDYIYRGKQFAAQNGFCNAGDTAYPGSTCPSSLPSRASRSVQIDQGTFAGGTWTSSAGGAFVRAVASQQQPAYLAAVLGLSTVNIGAQAIVQVKNPKELCALGLARWSSSTNAITIGGSSQITGNGCGLMSNDTVKFNSTPNFSGPNWAVNAVNGCISNQSLCNSVAHNYSMLPAENPLRLLDSQTFNSRTGNTSPLNRVTPCPVGVPADVKNCYTVTPNSSGAGAYKDLTVTTGDYVIFDIGASTSGTFFFYNAAIKINGGYVKCNCTSTNGVTLVLLGDSSLSISGATVELSAPAVNSFSSLLNGVLIDDQALNKTKNAVNINGGGTVKLGGAMYFPNVDVSYTGTAQNINTTCAEVIANTLTIGGNASYISTQGCNPNTVAHSQVIALVH